MNKDQKAVAEYITGGTTSEVSPSVVQGVVMSDDPRRYGQNCPKGMVQIEFVGCSPKNRMGDYGWAPEESAFLDIYVDGVRFRIQVGDFHDGRAQRRGLHIVGPIEMACELTSVNACSVWRKET